MVRDLFEVYETDLSLRRDQAGLKHQAFGLDLAESKALKLIAKDPDLDIMIYNATLGQIHAMAWSDATKVQWIGRKQS